MSAEKREADSARPEFWSQRYVSGRKPWQLDRVPIEVERFVRTLPPRCETLIPGCGEDIRIIRAFRDAGHSVTAIDFSAVAVDQAKKSIPELSDDIIVGDFFSYDFAGRHFNIVYERTFLCSLPLRLWQKYAARVADLLRSRGKLAGFFFYGTESDPPPYPLDEDTAMALFGSRFDLIKSETARESLPIFTGMEKWQEWMKK